MTAMTKFWISPPPTLFAQPLGTSNGRHVRRVWRARPQQAGAQPRGTIRHEPTRSFITARRRSQQLGRGRRLVQRLGWDAR